MAAIRRKTDKQEQGNKAAAALRSADMPKISPASDVSRQLLEAERRRASSPQRSEETNAAVSPPPANRGGKWEISQKPDVFKPAESVQLVLENGTIKQVPKRRGYGGSAAVVDWINFTVGVETFDHDDCTIGPDTVLHDDDKKTPLSDDDYIIGISRKLKAIFGYGISHALGYGQHFYEQVYAMSEGWGTVGIGGQRDTILVSISGTGLAAAKEGWELRLKEFLTVAVRAKITRVDLAHDDYTGTTYTVDHADLDHTNGAYNCGGRNPRCEYRGDWKTPDGKGRTFNVGNRRNGKFARIYEKGRQLGCPSSDWVRIEVEFKSVDRIIPFDVLTSPGEYLAAAYPAFAWIATHQERIETTQKTCEISVDRAVEVVRHQFGAYVHHLVEILGVEDFLKKVSRSNKIPAFAKVPHFGLSEPAIHETKTNKPPLVLELAAAAW